MLLVSAFLPFLLSTSVAALSNADLISVFGQATDLTGSSIVLPQFTLSVITNTTHALVSMNATASKTFQVGWMGHGVGSAMVNSDFLVTWPNPLPLSGTPPPAWTISHRQSPAGESEPTSLTNTDQFFTFLPALSSTQTSTDSYTVVSYVRLLAPPSTYMTSSNFKTLSRAKTSFIFASSTVQPQNPAVTATLTQHDQPHYAISLDLSLPVSLSSTAASTTNASTTASAGSAASTAAAADAGSGITATVASTARTSRDMILIAHGVFGSLALLVITPIAIMIPRFFRNRHWFPYHAALQVLSALFVIIAFALAVKGTEMGFQSNFFDGHTRLGLVIFILVMIQVIGGSMAHRSKGSDTSVNTVGKFPTLAPKSPIRFLHIGSGLVIVVLGWIQIKSGFEEYELYSDMQMGVPKGVSVVYWLLVAFWTLMYAFGWYREMQGSNRSLVASEAVVEPEEKTVVA